MSGGMRDLLGTTLGLPAVLSLLGAGAIGVWVCANTLADIKHSLEDQSKQLAVHGADIAAVKNDVGELKSSQHDLAYSLEEIKRQAEENERADVKRGKN